MRARIMLLPGSEQGEIQCGYAERLLIDISAAFDHTFSLMRGKLEEPVPEKTLEGCESSQAVMLGDAACPAAQALYDALALPLRIRCLCVPETLCGREETPARLWIGTVLSLDSETLREAMQAAFQFAREEDARILHIAPAGASKGEWTTAVRVQGASNPLISVDGMSAPDAAAALVRQPGRLGLLLCAPYAGSMLEAEATCLCPHPEVMYDIAPDTEIGVYAPHPTPADETGMPSPFAAALATARMLRYSLHLTREAACLEAAVQNVMANGWQAQEGTETQASTPLDRICEQIAVAGELMGKGGMLS